MGYDCLIIDDEKLLADSTAEYFNLFGVSTAVAYSAGDCRRFFETDTAKLLLLDINLKGAFHMIRACYRDFMRKRLRPVQGAAGEDGDSDSLHLRPQQR